MLDASRSPPLTFADPHSAGSQSALRECPACVGCVLVAVLPRAAVIGCGSWKRVGSEDAADARRDAHPRCSTPRSSISASAGSPPASRCRSSAPWRSPPGPATRVIAVLGLSLENRALAFQREGQRLRRALPGEPLLQAGGRAARWIWRARRSSGSPPSRRRSGPTRASCSSRSFVWCPGKYKVTVTVRDAGSTAESRATGEYTAPSFGRAPTQRADPAYQATGRGNRGRSAQPGAQPARRRRLRQRHAARVHRGLRLRRARRPCRSRCWTSSRTSIYNDSLRFRGGRQVESQVDPARARQRVPRRARARGRRRHAGAAHVSALVSFTQAWVVTNFDEMLDLLRYFGAGRDGSTPCEGPRPASARGSGASSTPRPIPTPATPENEALNQYFGRISAANQRFTDEGVPGWRTDRGEVFITLGPPDESVENTPGTGEPDHPVDLPQPIAWSSTSRTRPASAACGSPRHRGRSTSGSCAGETPGGVAETCIPSVARDRRCGRSSLRSG